MPGPLPPDEEYLSNNLAYLREHFDLKGNMYTTVDAAST
jgi:hypothetical protein